MVVLAFEPPRIPDDVPELTIHIVARPGAAHTGTFDFNIYDPQGRVVGNRAGDLFAMAEAADIIDLTAVLDALVLWAAEVVPTLTGPEQAALDAALLPFA